MFKYLHQALFISLIVLAVVWVFRFRSLKEGLDTAADEPTSEPQVKTLKAWLEEVAPNFFGGYMNTLRGISAIYDKIVATWAESVASGKPAAQFIPEVKMQMIEEAKMSFPDYSADLLEATRLYEAAGDYKEPAQKFAGAAIFKYTPGALKAQLAYFQKKLYAMAEQLKDATTDSSVAASQMASAPAGMRSSCGDAGNQGFIDYLRVSSRQRLIDGFPIRRSRTRPGAPLLDLTARQGFIDYPQLPPPSEDVLRAPFLAFRQVFNNDTMSTLNTLVDTCTRLTRRLDGISDDAQSGDVKAPPAPC